MDPNAEAVKTLTSMGFSEDRAKEALRDARDNLDQAVAMLTSVDDQKPDPKIEQLVDMGFTEAQATGALGMADGNVEIALQALQDAVGHLDPAANVPSSADNEDQAPKIKQIVDMGFTEAQAKSALDMADGNVEAAIELFLEMGGGMLGNAGDDRVEGALLERQDNG